MNFRRRGVVLSAVLIPLALGSCRTVHDVRYVRATNADKAGDHAHALALYRDVANAEGYDGQQAAQFRLAQMHFEGIGTRKDPGVALRIWESVAKGPDPSWRRLANVRLGLVIQAGIPGVSEPDLLRLTLAIDFALGCG